MHRIHHVRQINNPKLRKSEYVRKSEYKVRNQTKAIKLGFYKDETGGNAFLPPIPYHKP